MDQNSWLWRKITNRRSIAIPAASKDLVKLDGSLIVDWENFRKIGFVTGQDLVLTDPSGRRHFFRATNMAMAEKVIFKSLGSFPTQHSSSPAAS